MAKNKINVKEAISNMTLKEKASLCSGADFWLTKKVKRLSIPDTRMADGPHGLRKENNFTGTVGMKGSFPATSFPPAVNIASTWSTDISNKVGEMLALQSLNQHVSVVLGPGVNIKRSPLCGRNFEYFSEDPILASKLAVAYINGCQEKGVGTSIKHYAANNQETLRMSIDTLVDIRALNEIYLKCFEEPCKKARPWTIMCSYNRINNTYASDNKYLLNDVLREKWGYDGIVVSDWNATNDRVEGIRVGMDLEMPGTNGSNDKKIVKAVKEGLLDEKELDKVVERLLNYINKCADLNTSNYFIHEEDEQLYKKGHELARKVASESFVLMKNEDKNLPYNKNDDFAVIGALADEIRYQGSGSSRINPYKLVNFLDMKKDKNLKFEYAPGYSVKRSDADTDKKIAQDAIELAKKSKKILYFMGLTDLFECEGYDRNNLEMPENQVSLLESISKVNDNITIVLFGGSPVNTDCFKYAKSVLNVYLPGEAAGQAIYDVIFGDVNPSGRLAETYPISLDDCFYNQYYKMGPISVEHRESIFVGYRYYDTANIPVAFPFGFGLSYSSFEYSNLTLSSKAINDDQKVTVSFDIKNTSDVDGYEVAQVYVQDNNPVIFKAKKELKGFKKVFIKAKSKQTVTIELDREAFSYFATDINDWHVESGEYTIHICKNVNEVILSDTLNVKNVTTTYSQQSYEKVYPSYYNIAGVKSISDEEFVKLLGRDLVGNTPKKRGELDLSSTLYDMRESIIGKAFLKIGPVAIKKSMPDLDFTSLLMMEQGMKEMPIRGLVGITQGLVNFKIAKGLLLWANKRRLLATGYLLVGSTILVGSLIKTIHRGRKQKSAYKKMMKNKK